MPRSIDQAPSVILAVLRLDGPGCNSPATRPELEYEKGQPGAAPMWQWTRQRPQADTIRRLYAGKPRLLVGTEKDGRVRPAGRTWNPSRVSGSPFSRADADPGGTADHQVAAAGGRIV